MVDAGKLVQLFELEWGVAEARYQKFTVAMDELTKSQMKAVTDVAANIERQVTVGKSVSRRQEYSPWLPGFALGLGGDSGRLLSEITPWLCVPCSALLSVSVR